MSDNAQDDVTIRHGSRLVPWQLLIVGVALIVGVYRFATERASWMYFLGVAVVLPPVALIIHKATYLRLGPEGFTASWLGIRTRYRWSDVERFEVSGSLAGQTVTCRLAPHAKRLRNNGSLYRWAWGESPVLFPSTWHMGAQELSDMLNAAKRAEHGKEGWIRRDGICEGDSISTLVNVSARSMIGNPLYGHYLRVSVPFHDADEKGFPTSAENLVAVEAELRRTLEADSQSIHVATTTFRNARDYLFYTQDMHASLGRLAEVIEDTINREVRFEAKPDPGWKVYANLAS